LTDLRVEARAGGEIAVLGAGGGDRRAVAEASRELPVELLEEEGEGGELLLSLGEEKRAAFAEAAVRQAAETMRRRLDAFGVRRPRAGTVAGSSSRIRVELPGVPDPERIGRLLEETGRLELKWVEGEPAPEAELLARLGGEVPRGRDVVCTERSEATGPSSASEGLCYLLERTPAITGGDLETAQVGVGSFGDPVVLVTLTEPAGVRFGHATAANVGRQLAILLDGRVLTAPVVQTEIGSEAVIEGGFSEQEAQDLAVLLRAGALPAPARIVASEPIPAGPWLRSYRLALPAAGIVTALSAAAAFVLALRLLRLRRVRDSS
jgi:preprotein translocase subunit SecD